MKFIWMSKVNYEFHLDVNGQLKNLKQLELNDQRWNLNQLWEE